MTTFADLGLSPSIVKTVADTGYTIPTPIQEQAIPVALAGRDVLGIAQTGTGKTAAFTLPMIDRLQAGRSKARMPRSLVLAPTRELADQVASAFEKYAAGGKLSWALLIGGVSFDEQLRKLDRGVDVLIATPGRLLDHFERGKLLLTGVQIMVVDEADRMLDMGFIPDIERIFKLTPANRQTLFFSATMPPEITRLTAQFLKDPTRIEATRPATTADTIGQFIARVPMTDAKAKRMALRELISREEVANGIVFCNRKTDVDIVAKSLKKYGFDAAPIHGDLDQTTRMKTLESFRNNELKLLVASDVAARGLDIPAVTHVFNYDVPFHADDYVHRIGRTGRAGRTGKAFMIVTPGDAKAYDKVLKLTKKEPEEVPMVLDWSLAQGGDSERRSRSGGRSSERSARSRPRPIAERDPSEAMPTEAFKPIEPAIHAEGDTPKPARRERAPRAPRKTVAAAPVVEVEVAPVVEAAPERPKVRAEERLRPIRGVQTAPVRDFDDHNTVVGFGRDIPAFLARPTPLPPASRKSASGAED